MLIEILIVALAGTAMGFCFVALRENAGLRVKLAQSERDHEHWRVVASAEFDEKTRLRAEKDELYERMLRGGQPMYAAFEDGAEPVSTREADRRVVESRRPAGYEPIEVRDKTVEPPPRLTDSVGDEEDEG